MSGYILHMGATVMCVHSAQAQPTSSNPRVKVSGQPVVTQSGAYTIAGCPFAPPVGNGPCITAQWVMGATRIMAGGVPVLLQDSQAICTPTGTGLNIMVTQVRVKGM